MRLKRLLKPIPMIVSFTCFLLPNLLGCAANKIEAILESKSGYFPNGLTVEGQRFEGEYYLLSKEAYEAMLGL